mgnify:CR=1 FL=1
MKLRIRIVFLLVNQDVKTANKVINQLNKSDIYYQENMGREWLLRKEMIRTLIGITVKLSHLLMAIKLRFLIRMGK